MSVCGIVCLHVSWETMERKKIYGGLGYGGFPAIVCFRGLTADIFVPNRQNFEDRKMVGNHGILRALLIEITDKLET